MTNRAVLALCFVLGLPAAAAADDPQSFLFPAEPGRHADTITIPLGSPLTFSGIDHTTHVQKAVFNGRVLLTGKYYYGDGEFNDGDTFSATAWIVPDPDSALQLPHLVNTGKDDPVFLSNPLTFAQAVLSPTDISRASQHHGPRASGHISIWVDQFAINTGCGGSTDYDARFLSVENPVIATIGSGGGYDC